MADVAKLKGCTLLLLLSIVSHNNISAYPLLHSCPFHYESSVFFCLQHSGGVVTMAHRPVGGLPILIGSRGRL